jgi:hypothetical protein
MANYKAILNENQSLLQNLPKILGSVIYVISSLSDKNIPYTNEF